MLKSESLIQLVNNLTKQEKKEFSLYITNKSEKDYIFLFRLIDDKKISACQDTPEREVPFRRNGKPAGQCSIVSSDCSSRLRLRYSHPL